MGKKYSYSLVKLNNFIIIHNIHVNYRQCRRFGAKSLAFNTFFMTILYEIYHMFVLISLNHTPEHFTCLLMSMSNLETFFGELESHLRLLENCQPEEEGVDRCQNIVMRGHEYVRCLSLFVNRLYVDINISNEGGSSLVNGVNISDVIGFYIDLNQLFRMSSNIVTVFEERSLELFQDDEATCIPEFECGHNRGFQVGRPSFSITRGQLETFQEIGFSITQTARILGVSRHTIINRRREYGMGSTHNWTDISDRDLDELISAIYRLTPDIGERYTIGALNECGVRVQRRRIREAIIRVDPVGRACRARRVIFRRQYNVLGPNSLW